ncbi:MAG TPA: immune inhibitor A domain-containing protein [Flexivirga sp.]|uniref:immune inhibitor A domain-containing protein n=1 Tax=Flexivirga sp. TaxID=1962927 RepID=UPI002B8A46DA|nr:immune inhibitor A domain-containing protein [Flexivirga sp.]HWC23959.1 immune inhibitor A domain-containing protein [Flexivirga sp.]
MTRRVFKTIAGTTAFAATASFAIAGLTQPADAQAIPSAGPGLSHRSDNLPNPRAEKQAAERQAAVDKLVKGKAKIKTIAGKKVIELQAPESARTHAERGKGTKAKKGKYVQYDPNQSTKIFTTLAEFGTQTKAATGGTEGPLHNTIPEPDRTKNNSTYWVDDFNQSHYDDLFNGAGESFKNFYKDQSQGRFEVDTTVSDWVKVPYNEARYGHNPVKGDGTSEAEGYWSFVQDSLTSWYDKQIESGKTKDEIKAELKQFDSWDRYDYDGDGDFNEPDGYIDHYEALHAGEGEEAGGGAEGDDAIWSHRWAVQTGYGTSGPEGNKSGGVQIGDTGIWVSDYTTEPENGGLGVFTHEFGHDLGLPDLYDTSGGGDNTVGFWSLMSSGSWLNHGKDSIGTTPGYMDAWSKVQLGWSDLQTVKYGENTDVKLGPADLDNSKKPQAVAVSLPDKEITTDYNTPKSGSYEWWSGSADNLNNTLSREIDLTGATSASVSAAAWYDIEQDYDFLYGQVSTDGGSTWTTVGDGVTGTKKEWSTVNFDLTPYVGKSVLFRFAYQTDGGVHNDGAFLDDLAVTIDGTATTDDVESTESAWTADGFARMTGSNTVTATHYYLAESRRYAGYDATLKTGPYNFGFTGDKADWVEHYPYQDGLLVWYIDNEYEDNNTSQHPGRGQVLPVDAHPAPVVWKTGEVASNRIQSYDSTFGVDKTDKFTLHRKGTTLDLPKKAGVPMFDDSVADAYWSSLNPTGSVQVAGSGTQIVVKGKQGDGLRVQVKFTK